MQPRIDLTKVSPEAYQAMLGVEKYIRSCGLERELVELVNMRSSQINGCAYCLDMHSKDARAAGETEQRLYTLNGWREAPFFSDRERAALAWTEAVTQIADTHAPDDAFEPLREHFSEKEIVDLTLAITTINAWNRLMISFRVPPGNYQPPKHRAPAVAAAAQ
jgi:AhpD family alkylhydroperoxidase